MRYFAGIQVVVIKIFVQLFGAIDIGEHPIIVSLTTQPAYGGLYGPMTVFMPLALGCDSQNGMCCSAP
jgi:hypothetical protein